MKLKGDLQIVIDKNNIYAYLKFIPGESGSEWALEKVLSRLQEMKIIEGIRKETISQFLIDAQGFSAEKQSGIIAEGVEPEAPLPEILEIEKFKLDSNTRKIMEKIIAAAPDPKISSDSGEELSVDPFVLKSGMIRKGDLLGKIIPASIGKPGKDLYDQDIEIPPLAQKRFYISEGLKRNGLEINALETGFFRIGRNWADLIPYRIHFWQISFSKDKASCFLIFSPGGAEQPLPDPLEIIEAAEDENYPIELLITPDRISDFLKKCVSERDKKTDFKVCISQKRDALVDLNINVTKTKAVLKLKKGTSSGSVLTLKNVSSVLNASKIKGYDVNKVKQEILDFFHSEKMETEILLVEGTAPERGEDRQVHFKIDFLKDDDFDEIIGKIDSNPELIKGYSSFRDFPAENIQQMALVEKGQELFALGNVEKGRAGRDIYGNKVPGIPGNDPVINIFEGVEYKDGIARASSTGILDLYIDQNNYYLRIRRHQNARYRFHVSENKMAAYLNTRLPEGSGLDISEEKVKAAAEESGITTGFLDDKIAELVTQSSEGEIVTDFLIAEGKYPSNEKTLYKLYVDLDPNAKTHQPIKAGEIFGEILNEANDKKDGYTVTGEIIEHEGKGDLKIGSHIRQEEQDGKILLKALKSGNLYFENNSLFIKDKLTIKGDVSIAVGNIKFPGSIEIQGSVLSRMVVNAGEKITIDEVVQAALVSSDSDITIGKGVKGEGKAILRCQGDLELGFAEDANIMVVGKLKLNKALMNCRIKCNSKIEKANGNVRIIGGNIKVREGLIVDSLGSDRSSKTTISFGQDYLVSDQIDTVTNELTKMNNYLTQIDELMEKIEQKGPGARKALMEARKKKVKTMKIIEKKNLRLFLLREKFEKHFDSEIIVKEEIFPGVIFETHGRFLEIKEKSGGLKIKFNPQTGKIESQAI